eukprot:sb/3472606/
MIPWKGCTLLQSDPVLPGSSGERIFPGISGLNTVNFLYRGKFILPVNRGSDCTTFFGGRDYIMEEAITGDYALIKAYKADEAGNLIFRQSANNFNQPMATAGRITIAESDPVLPGSSGERIFPGISGLNTVNFLYRGKFILPVNRGSGISGPGKSGSDCNKFM